MSAYDMGRVSGMIFLAVFVIAIVMRVARGAGEKGPGSLPGARPDSGRQAKAGAAQGKARGAGACLFLGGIVLMFVLQWLMRAHGAELMAGETGAAWTSPARWEFRLARTAAAVLPALAGAGLALLACGAGKAAFPLGGVLGLAGLAAGILFAMGMPPANANAVHDTLAGWMDAALGGAGLTRPAVGRKELDAALADARATAAELAQRQATVNRADKTAVDALKKEIDAYNAREAVVKRMYDDYMAGPQATASLAKQVAGTWKRVENRADGGSKSTTVRFDTDGTAHFEVMKIFGTGGAPPPPDFAHMTAEERQNVDTSSSTGEGMRLDGTWAMYGRALAIRTEDLKNEFYNTTGSEVWTVESVDDKSLTVTTAPGKLVWQKVPAGGK